MFTFLLYCYISPFIMYCLRQLLFKVVYKHVSMTSLLALWKPTYPQSFVFIYGFLFELRVLNLNKENNVAQYIYDGEDLGHPCNIQSTTVQHCNYRIVALQRQVPSIYSINKKARLHC